MSSSYVGRFAPTPSGPLHFGSIIAALGSFLDARSNNGQWLLRMDDIDIPRIRAGAGDAILRGLEVLGLCWDGNVLYQSSRQDSYLQVIEELQSRGLIYPCFCPRKLVKGSPYPGTCRNRKKIPPGRHSLRIITDTEPLLMHDEIQGDLNNNAENTTGDFIIHRSDGLIAYNLAVVIDDEWQKVTHIVRGSDLINTTLSQIYLQKLLGYTMPHYRHLPVAVTGDGRKISKTDHAQDVLQNGAVPGILVAALNFLGQEPDNDLLHAGCEEIIGWGIKNWQLLKVPGQKEMKINW